MKVPAADQLRANGIRPTAIRLAVLAAAADHPHASADDIATATRERLGTASTAAIYDVLTTLATAGLLRRIEPAGSPARYEIRRADNHHHIVCRRCGVVRDVDCVRGAAPCLEPNELGGFVLDEAEVTWWGYCPNCQDGS